MPGEGAVDIPSSLCPPEPGLSALPPVLPHRDPEKELRTRDGGQEAVSPTGPHLCCWESLARPPGSRLREWRPYRETHG